MRRRQWLNMMKPSAGSGWDQESLKGTAWLRSCRYLKCRNERTVLPINWQSDQFQKGITFIILCMKISVWERRVLTRIIWSLLHRTSILLTVLRAISPTENPGKHTVYVGTNSQMRIRTSVGMDESSVVYAQTSSVDRSTYHTQRNRKRTAPKGTRSTATTLLSIRHPGELWGAVAKPVAMLHRIVRVMRTALKSISVAENLRQKSGNWMYNRVPLGAFLRSRAIQGRRGLELHPLPLVLN